jgi:hypothetical protein
MLIAALASPYVPACALAESVFDASRARTPQVRLELIADTRSCGPAGGAVGAGYLAPEAPGGVSPLKAATSSLLLPGLGERRLGHSLRAKIFFGLEAAGWISIASFLWAGHSRELSSEDFAVVFAGVTDIDHADDYYKTISKYMSSDGPGGYNEGVRREARDLYYPDVEAMDSYYRSHAMTGDESWQWRDETAYLRYGHLRDGSRFAYRVALYSAIGIAALRIVSAADAVRLARLEGQNAASAGATSVGLETAPRSVMLFVQRSF